MMHQKNFEITEQFRSAMLAAGITPPVIIKADGRKHRFPTNGSAKDMAGVYCVYTDDIPAGYFLDYRTGIFQTWRYDFKRPYTMVEEQQLQEAAKKRKVLEGVEQAAAARKAQVIWDIASNAPTEYPYFVKKKIKPLRAKVHKGCIIIPVTKNNQIIALQFIDANGKKRFLPSGCTTNGGYLSLGIPDKVLCFVEGYATGITVHEATGYAVVITFSAGNMPKIAQALRSQFRKALFVMCADVDFGKDINTGLKAAEEAARLVNGIVVKPEFKEPRPENATDFNDQSSLYGLESVKSVLESKLQALDATPIPSLIKAISLGDLLQLELAPREYILSPFLAKSGLAMIYAYRGIGKTFVALEIAMAVAYGDKFLCFEAPIPRKVLYIDGEMPATSIQERLASIDKRKKPNPNMIEPLIITPDLQTEIMPNLSTLEGQEQIEPYVQQAELIVVDNISTLCGGTKENEAEGWLPIQQWVLSIRKRGKSVLFIHHAGKNGSQRGTSKREDILDTVIKLKHPYDYEPKMGACFELHFEKARGIVGDEIKPIKCTLTDQGWTYEALEDTTYKQVVELLKNKYSQIEIARELDISKGYVSKIVKKAREKGDFYGQF